MKLPTTILEKFDRYSQNTRMQIDGLIASRRKNDVGMPLENSISIDRDGVYRGFIGEIGASVWEQTFAGQAQG